MHTICIFISHPTCLYGWQLVSLMPFQCPCLCIWGRFYNRPLMALQKNPFIALLCLFVEIAYRYYDSIFLELQMNKTKSHVDLSPVRLSILLCQAAPASSPLFAKWILSMTRPHQGQRWRSGGRGSWQWRATRVVTTSLTFKEQQQAPPVVFEWDEQRSLLSFTIFSCFLNLI